MTSIKNIITPSSVSLAEKADGAVRTVSPTLLLCGGGSGAQIGRSIKAYIREQKMEPWFRILVLDTDSREQQSDGILPGFSDEEFCLLSMARVKPVLAEPSKHSMLEERLDLDDPEIHGQLSSIMEKNLLQAGQVRPLGLLAYYANLDAVRGKLKKPISDLNSRWAELTNQINCPDQIRRQAKFNVIMVGSSCGGTFSSLAIDLAVEVKKLIPNDNVEQTLLLLTPDVWENQLLGKSKEYERLKVNSHECLQECDAFSNGWAQRQKIKIGRCEAEATLVPAGLWNQKYLVSRCDSAGHDLETPENVCATVAHGLGAEIALSIGGKISALQQNDPARQGLSHCPDTHLPRSFSTLNSAALVLPRKLLVRTATARQLFDMYAAALGADVSVGEGVDVWLLENELEERAGFSFTTSCLRATAPATEEFLRPLIRQKGRNIRHKNRRYGPLYLATREKFQDALPEIEAVMQQERGNLTDRAKQHLEEKLDWLFAHKGLIPAQDFLTRVETEIDEIVEEKEDGIRNEQAAAQKLDEAAKLATAKMMTFFGRIGRTESRQVSVENCFRRFISLTISYLAGQQVLILMADLKGQINRERTRLTAEIGGIKAELNRLEEHVENDGKPRSVVGDNASEVDITPDDFRGRFYEENALQPSTLLEQLAGLRHQTMAEVMRACGADSARVTSSAKRLATSHFDDALAKINVVDVLGRTLAGPDTAAAEKVKTQIREALGTTNPLWDAELSRIDESFADFTVIGLPSVNGVYGKLVTDFFVKEAAAVMTCNPLYQGAANIVQTQEDSLRIHIVRRTHGARPYYLRGWRDWKYSSRKWKEARNHPTSVFPKKWRDSLPMQEPREEASRTDLGFAIAQAYGFVSRRGKWYTRNLILQERGGVSRWVVPFTSHGASIAFENQKPKAHPPGSALATFVDAGRVSFTGREDVDPRVRLADGRDKALEAFRKDEAFCDLVFNAFDAICEVAGNLNVAKELHEYLLLLDGQVKAGAKYYEQISEEVELLAGLMQELSMHG